MVKSRIRGYDLMDNDRIFFTQGLLKISNTLRSNTSITNSIMIRNLLEILLLVIKCR